MRLFIALDFSKQTQERLANFQNGALSVAWSPVQQLHLTLSFLGECDFATYKILRNRLADISFSSFQLTIEGVDFFANSFGPHTLYLKIQESPELVQLQKQVQHIIREIPLELEKRKFVPHVTLGKIPKNTQSFIQDFLDQNSTFTKKQILIESFALFSSKLGSTHAAHTLEEKYYSQNYY